MPAHAARAPMRGSREPVPVWGFVVLPLPASAVVSAVVASEEGFTFVGSYGCVVGSVGCSPLGSVGSMMTFVVGLVGTTT